MRELYEIGKAQGALEQRVTALESFASLIKRLCLVILIWLAGIALNLPPDLLSAIQDLFK